MVSGNYRQGSKVDAAHILTDEHVWLLKLIWFQGHDLCVFDPWFYRGSSSRSRHNPTYESVEELAQHSQRPVHIVSALLEDLAQADWINDTCFPIYIRKKESLLNHLCHLQSTRPLSGYYIDVNQDERYCDPARELAKQHVVPISGRIVIRNRLCLSALSSKASWKRENRAWTKQVDMWSAQSFHPVLKELPLIFHNLHKTIQSDKRQCISNIKNHIRLHFEPCNLESANVICMDSNSWNQSIFGATSHMGDLPSVDLLQCYIDLHTIAPVRSDFEDSTVVTAVRNFLLDLPLGHGLSLQQATT